MRWATWNEIDSGGWFKAIDVAAGGTSTVWALGDNGSPYHWKGNNWVEVTQGLTGKMTGICLDKDGVPMVIGNSGLWTYQDGSWFLLRDELGSDVAAYESSKSCRVTEVVDSGLGGYQIHYFLNGGWRGASSGTRVAANHELMFYLNAADEVYQADTSEGAPKLDKCILDAGKGIIDVAAGADGSVWAAGTDTVWFWTGTNWKTSDDVLRMINKLDVSLGSAKIKAISAFADGRPLICLSDGRVLRLHWKHQQQVKVTGVTPDPHSAYAFHVSYDGKSIGTVNVEQGARTTLKTDQEEDHFVMQATLKVDAASIPEAAALANGATHFNAYQIILVDTGPTGEASHTPTGFGEDSMAPNIDPPQGGFPGDAVGNGGPWSDNIPWYLDEMMPAGHANPEMMPAKTGQVFSFNDDPHLNSGGVLVFRTWLVAVASDFFPACFLGGYGWTCIGNEAEGRNCKIETATPFPYPSVHDYEYLIYQDSNGPGWFDDRPGELAPWVPGMG